MRFAVFQKEKNVFLDHKNKKLKKMKNWEFFERGQSMVLVSNLKFFSIFLFERKQARKIRFTTFQKGKTPFQSIKQEVKWLWSKIYNFSIFLFQAKQARKMRFISISAAIVGSKLGYSNVMTTKPRQLWKKKTLF